ncbi:hypothetical protein DFH07DRAFT_952226 [Mycena maculata]|uniref:Uncharacterized protein n=1 Tax=Mycena maculata TaxID=230809 RepID=A0AAD7NSX6_9AGAR|nr:hypothetical protein DFH07DRAFT_952226 [Mycena maculata]
MYHKEDATEFLSEDEEEVPDLVEVVSDDDVNATGEQRLVMYAHLHSSLPSRVFINTLCLFAFYIAYDSKFQFKNRYRCTTDRGEFYSYPDYQVVHTNGESVEYHWAVGNLANAHPGLKFRLGHV